MQILVLIIFIKEVSTQPVRRHQAPAYRRRQDGGMAQVRLLRQGADPADGGRDPGRQRHLRQLHHQGAGPVRRLHHGIGYAGSDGHRRRGAGDHRPPWGQHGPDAGHRDPQ